MGWRLPGIYHLADGALQVVDVSGESSAAIGQAMFVKYVGAAEGIEQVLAIGSWLQL